MQYLSSLPKSLRFVIAMIHYHYIILIEVLLHWLTNGFYIMNMNTHFPILSGLPERINCGRSAFTPGL